MTPPLARTVKSRAQAQAGFNTETRQGRVTRIYRDSHGFATAFDVHLVGMSRPLTQVRNGTTNGFFVGAQVTVNFVRGNQFDTCVIGAASGGTSGAATQAAGQAATDLQTQLDSLSDLSRKPLLLWEGDADLPFAEVLTAGTNVTLLPLPPADPSGGDVNARLQVSVQLPVFGALPSASAYPDGTLVVVVASGVATLYDRIAGAWTALTGAGGGGGSCCGEPITNGSIDSPEILFAGGDVVMSGACT